MASTRRDFLRSMFCTAAAVAVAPLVVGKALEVIPPGPLKWSTGGTLTAEDLAQALKIMRREGVLGPYVAYVHPRQLAEMFVDHGIQMNTLPVMRNPPLFPEIEWVSCA